MRSFRGLITKLALPLALILVLSVSMAFAAKKVTKYGWLVMGDGGAVSIEAEDGFSYKLIGVEGMADDDYVVLKGELDGETITVQEIEKTERQPGGPTY